MVLRKYEAQANAGLLQSWHGLRFRLLLEGVLVGLLAGITALAFRRSLELAESWRNQLFAWAHGISWWGWVAAAALLAVAGAAAGWLTAFAPEAAGSGIPHVAAVLRDKRRLNWRRVIPVKFLGGVLAIGAGLSLGREGPTVQLGAAAGQAVSRGMGRPKVEERYLIVCGAGAGLSAAFNAPLAGVIFVLEELQRNFSPYVFGTALVATVVADAASQLFLGPLPTFRIGELPRLPLAALPLFILLGFVAGLLGIAFNQALRRALSTSDRLEKWPVWARPVLAGLLAAGVGFFLPQALGGGHALAEEILRGRVSLGLIPLLFLVKFALTMVSYSSGVPGGIFLPLLVLGALLGSLYGQLVGLILPSLAGSATGFAVVAMAAYFTAIVRTPITGIVLVVEMTAGYEYMLDLLAASVTAYAVAEALRSEPVYEMLMQRDEARNRRPGVRGVYLGDLTLVELVVESGSPLDGKKVKDVRLPEECLLVGARRGTREFLPRGNTRLVSGDHISLFAPAGLVDEIGREFFRAREISPTLPRVR